MILKNKNLILRGKSIKLSTAFMLFSMSFKTTVFSQSNKDISCFEKLFVLENCLKIDSISSIQNSNELSFSLFISPLGFTREIEVFIENNDALCFAEDLIYLNYLKSKKDIICSNDEFVLKDLLSTAKKIKKITFFPNVKSNIHQYSGDYYDLMVKSRHQLFNVRMDIFNIGTNVTYLSNKTKMNYKSSRNQIQEKIGYFNEMVFIRFSSTYNLENNYDFEQFRIIFYSPEKLEVVLDNVVSFLNSDIVH